MAIYSKGGGNIIWSPPTPPSAPITVSDSTSPDASVFSPEKERVWRQSLFDSATAHPYMAGLGLGDLDRALQAGIPFPDPVRAQLKQALNDSGMGVGEFNSFRSQAEMDAASDALLLVSLANARSFNQSNVPFGSNLSADLRNFGELDFTGLTSAFLGDPNPRGLLGVMIDPVADLTGTKPEELLAIGKFGVGALNPFVAAGMQVAPSFAYGAPLDAEGMLQSAALSAGIGYGADMAAPYLSSAMDDLRTMWADVGAEPPAISNLPPMPPAGATPMTGEFPMPAAIPVSSAEQAASTFGSPAFLPGYDTAYGGMLGLDQLDMEDAANRDVLEAGDMPQPAPEPTVTGADVQRYAKLARTVNSLLSSESPADAPTRDEGETDEQYAGDLAGYLGLDAATMAEAGLTPGSPEYMAYILDRADFTIEQVLGDMDVDSDDLAAQLRSKTEAELLQLQRALFVRGQMDQLMGAGTYTDPMSGVSEEVLGEGMFNPNVAAFQRGKARDVQTLAGLRGTEALSYLDSLLGRQGDPFDMQSAADARYQEALLEPRDDDTRRRRGMFY